MHPRMRSAVLSRGVYAEIILQQRAVGDAGTDKDEDDPRWHVVKAVYARQDGHDPHRIPHNIVLEAKVLQRVAHRNIVELLEYDFVPSTSLHRLSLPLLACTLADLTPTIIEQNAGFAARSVAFQAVTALAHLHDHGIAHRDLNPKNIMFDWEGCLKLIDFSTSYAPGLNDTGEIADETVCQVGTGSYRAPELLFGAYTYDAPAIDLWGLGMCLGDIFRGSTPLFDASFGDIGLAASIFRVRGHPSHSWPDFERMPDADKVTFDPFDPQPLAQYLPRLADAEPERSQAVDFLEGLLRLDPAQRATAHDALQYPWLRDSVLLPKEYPARPGGASVTRLEDGRTLLDLLRPAIEAAEDRLDGVLGRDLD